MRLSSEKLKKICKKKNITLKKLLKEAGVSKNAYYSISSRNSVLPKSIISIANHLNIRPSSILEEIPFQQIEIKRLLETVERIVKRHNNVDPDNVRHTLILLQEKPINRLRMAIIRAQKFNIH